MALVEVNPLQQNDPYCTALIKCTDLQSVRIRDKKDFRCERLARYSLNGTLMCGQHAGSAAIQELLKANV